MENIVREVMKDDGRKQKIREKRWQGEAVANTAKRLKEMTKLTSGGLASNSMYQIVPEVHAEIKTRKAQRIAWDAATQEKRAAREERIESNRQAAREKRLVTARSSLQQQDIMWISAQLKQLGDSP
jgi:hypothetical protein